MAEVNHFRRLMILWIAASVVATPLVVILLGPLFPPGNASVQAAGHTRDTTVLAAVATPVLMLVVLYLLYAIVFFRQQPGAVLEGPAVRGDARVQTVWIVITSVLVLGLAAYGTAELVGDGSGSGEGPNPAFVPSGEKLQVQVIAQQWAFTYRYPSYGGVETPHLVLPVNTTVELHVTSLDVIHSFWAYQLGVKADANPDVDNVVFVKPTKREAFNVRCSELCGIWHGYMFDTGHVVSASAFKSWIARERRVFSPVTHYLPPYSTTYLPEPTMRGD
jgi:cytochrome c oxidase subunit 2